MFGRVTYTPLTLNYNFFTVAYIFTTVTKSYNNASYITKIWLLFSQDITNSDIFNLGQDLTMKCVSLCKIWQWFCLQQTSSEESITLYLMEFLKKNCAEPFPRASFKEIWPSIKWNLYMMLLRCKFMNYLQVTNKLLVMSQVWQNQEFFCLTLTCKTIQWVDSLVLLFSVF